MASLHSPMRTAEQPEPMIIDDPTVKSAERSGVAGSRAIMLSFPLGLGAASPPPSTGTTISRRNGTESGATPAREELQSESTPNRPRSVEISNAPTAIPEPVTRVRWLALDGQTAFLVLALKVLVL